MCALAYSTVVYLSDSVTNCRRKNVICLQSIYSMTLCLIAMRKRRIFHISIEKG